MGANGRIAVRARFTLTNSGSNQTPRVKLGSTAFWSRAIANLGSVVIESDIANRGSGASQFGGGLSYIGSTVASQTGNTGNVDTTVDQTIAITGQLSSAGDTMTLESFQIILYPKD
jgi:hypothetical protein